MIERKEISIDDLVIDTAQSRRGDWAGDQQDQRLVNSLETDGLLQSLLVRPVENADYDNEEIDAEYAIIAGSRRYHAAVEAGFDSVHCRVIDADDFEAAKKSLKENEDRKDLTDQEKARSLKMQFEMLRPEPPFECPECDGEYADIHKHWRRSGCESVTEQNKDASGLSSLTFYSDRDVYEYLSRVHISDATESSVQKIRQLISIAELPDELQAMWKPPEQRTEDEQETLQKFDIDRDLTAERGGDVSRLGDKVVQLHNSIQANTDSEAINATNAVLETVGRLDFNQTSVDLEKEINQFQSEIEDISEIDDTEEQEREFRSRLEQHEQELRELKEEINTTSIGRLNFRLNDQKYKRYHANAKQQLGEDSDTSVVRRGYQRYLEQQAEKHGW
jgi:hypothetical protein